jgi:hypothetical protein
MHRAWYVQISTWAPMFYDSSDMWVNMEQVIQHFV